MDKGAEKALTGDNKSLLPIGITKIEGNFTRGEVVRINGIGGEEVARGLVNYNAEELRKIMGCKSKDIEGILGYAGSEEVVHRDNLILR